jgi:hypothetical protein
MVYFYIHEPDEPLEVAAGEELRDDRTGEHVAVIAVEGEFMRVRYPDGAEKQLHRLNLYLSRLDDPGRPSPVTREVLRSAAAYRLRDRIVLHAEAKAGEALARAFELSTRPGSS